jgi:hypothetical protein
MPPHPNPPPARQAIRSAAVDLLVGSQPVPVTIAVTKTGTYSDWKASEGGRS